MQHETDVSNSHAALTALGGFRKRGENVGVAINRLRAQNDALLAALKPFADYFDGNLENVGGGTVVSVPFTVQQFKDAKAAIAAAESEAING